MDPEDYLNQLLEVCGLENNSMSLASELMTSLSLPILTRLRLFVAACMKNHHHAAAIVLNNGCEWSSGQAQRARLEIIEHLRSGSDDETKLDDFITCLFVLDNDDSMHESLVTITSFPPIWVSRFPADEGGFVSITIFDRNVDEDQASERLAEVVLEGGFLQSSLLKVVAFLSKQVKKSIKVCNGQTSLHLATIREETADVKFLLSHGADPNVIDEELRTPLHHAAQLEAVMLIQLLVHHGANVNSADRDGITPLHLLVKKNCEDGVKILLENGARVDLADAKSGFTALHYASHRGHGGEIFEMLIQHNADVNARDSTGKTPLFWAVLISCIIGRMGLIEKLLAAGASEDGDDDLLSLGVFSPFRNHPEGAKEKRKILAKLLAHGVETSSLRVDPACFNEVINRFNDMEINPQALKFVLEFGLVRDVAHLKRIHGKLHDGEHSNCGTLLEEHMVKLEAVGLLEAPADDDNSEEAGFPRNRGVDPLPGLRAACAAEVLKMQEQIPGARVTYQDVLFKSVTQLVRLTRNSAVVAALSGVEEAFPIYGTMLTGRSERGQVRRHWAEKVIRICNPLLNWQLGVEPPHPGVIPERITELVVANFRDSELKRFVIGHERDPVWPTRWIELEDKQK